MEEQTPKKFHFTKQMKIGLAVVLVLCAYGDTGRLLHGCGGSGRQECPGL